jgi:hypothetical protein
LDLTVTVAEPLGARESTETVAVICVSDCVVFTDVTLGPVMVRVGLAPKPLPVIVKVKEVPAFQAFRSMAITGVRSPTVNVTALLVPKRVDSVSW